MTTQEAMPWMDMILERYEEIFGATKDTVCYTVLTMARAALQASVPHVFTLEELSKKQGELIEREMFLVWCESKFEKQFDGWELMFRNSEVGNYGILWRCWSHKPTADQMAATPWKEGETE